jgi:hypothetical protein
MNGHGGWLLSLGVASLIAGAAQVAEPATNAPAAEPRTNLLVRLTNQSADLTDIDVKVYLDGKLVIDRPSLDSGWFHNFYTYGFHVALGEHTLKVVSAKGEATAEKTFQAGTQVAVDVSFWYSERRKIPKRFDLHIAPGGLRPTL